MSVCRRGVPVSTIGFRCCGQVLVHFLASHLLIVVRVGPYSACFMTADSRCQPPFKFRSHRQDSRDGCSIQGKNVREIGRSSFTVLSVGFPLSFLHINPTSTDNVEDAPHESANQTTYNHLNNLTLEHVQL